MAMRDNYEHFDNLVRIEFFDKQTDEQFFEEHEFTDHVPEALAQACFFLSHRKWKDVPTEESIAAATGILDLIKEKVFNKRVDGTWAYEITRKIEEVAKSGRNVTQKECSELGKKVWKEVNSQFVDFGIENFTDNVDIRSCTHTATNFEESRQMFENPETFFNTNDLYVLKVTDVLGFTCTIKLPKSISVKDFKDALAFLNREMPEDGFTDNMLHFGIPTHEYINNLITWYYVENDGMDCLRQIVEWCNEHNDAVFYKVVWLNP